MHTNHRLILASQSSRRRQLLADQGVQFEVMPPAPSAEPAGELPRGGESTAMFVQRLASQKAADVAGRLPYPALVIGCDTVAEVDGVILGKPIDETDARRILLLLSGRRHNVISGLTLIHSTSNLMWSGYAESQLDMLSLSLDDLQRYIRSGDWKGKSGAFGYQDGHPWLKLVSGTAENVVGLPLDLLDSLLHQADQDLQSSLG